MRKYNSFREYLFSKNANRRFYVYFMSFFTVFGGWWAYEIQSDPLWYVPVLMFGGIGSFVVFLMFLKYKKVI